MRCFQYSELAIRSKPRVLVEGFKHEAHRRSVTGKKRAMQDEMFINWFLSTVRVKFQPMLNGQQNSNSLGSRLGSRIVYVFFTGVLVYAGAGYGR